MNSINHGLFRVAITHPIANVRRTSTVVDKIIDVVSRYSLTVWDNDPKTLEMIMTANHQSRFYDYVDIHAVEQELYGDQPIHVLLEDISKIDGVGGVIFIDTASPYNVPIFKHHGKSSDPVIKNLKRSYVKEVADDYKQLLMNLVQD